MTKSSITTICHFSYIQEPQKLPNTLPPYFIGIIEVETITEDRHAHVAHRKQFYSYRF